MFSADQSSTYTINGYAWDDWRIRIGERFGVDSVGNLVCTNAKFSGSISSSSITGSTITAGNIKISENQIKIKDVVMD